MCDYSLEQYRSRDALANEELVVRKFRSGSKGFVDSLTEDYCAVCCKPGVEMVIHFEEELKIFSWCRAAIFGLHSEPLTGDVPVVFHTQGKGWAFAHRDGFIIPGGKFLSLQTLPEGTRATVTKALPKELTEAVKGDVAFEREIEVAPIERLRSLRRLFRLPAD